MRDQDDTIEVIYEKCIRLKLDFETFKMISVVEIYYLYFDYIFIFNF